MFMWGANRSVEKSKRSNKNAMGLKKNPARYWKRGFSHMNLLQFKRYNDVGLRSDQAGVRLHEIGLNIVSH